jgi:hypothetical protein
MRNAFVLTLLIVSFARALGTTFPEMRFEDDKLVISIIDFDQISTADIDGYITIDLRNFHKLHFRKDLFQFINEEMNEVTAYQALPQELEIMPGKKAKTIVIVFKFNINKTYAKGIFKK